jgi:hypothetical protein
MSKDGIYQELKNGIEDLQKNIDKFPPESCESIAFEVLKDSELQDAIVNLISQGYDFDRVSCEPFGSDQTKVTFGFRCRPPRICIVHPALRVTYDLSLKKRVGPIEYLPSH